jgi:hypothetical protein
VVSWFMCCVAEKADGVVTDLFLELLA